MQVIWKKNYCKIIIQNYVTFLLSEYRLIIPDSSSYVFAIIRRRVELGFDNISRKYREIRYWWAICNKEIAQNREHTRSPSYDLVRAIAPFRKNGCLRRRSMEEKKLRSLLDRVLLRVAVLTQLHDGAKKGRKEEERWSRRFLPRLPW